MLNYRTNGRRRRLGRPLKRLLDRAETGLLRPNSRWMMLMLAMVYLVYVLFIMQCHYNVTIIILSIFVSLKSLPFFRDTWYILLQEQTRKYEQNDAVVTYWSPLTALHNFRCTENGAKPIKYWSSGRRWGSCVEVHCSNCRKFRPKSCSRPVTPRLAASWALSCQHFEPLLACSKIKWIHNAN
jgi:hypothetical protein